MHILAVDDEQIMLNELITELNKVFPRGDIHGETEPHSAAKWAEVLADGGERLEYAFLDVRLKGINGIDLARRLRTLHPGVKFIFCTAYTEYAFDAVGMYAKGYLLKPVNAGEIVRTLDEMVADWRGDEDVPPQNVRIQTFGHFEIFVNGRPLSFEREKAKELLAYLVDRHGASVTTEQIASILWEDRVYDRTLKNYVGTVLASLKRTLSAAGVESILIKTRNHLSVDTTRFVCDAYEFEKSGANAGKAFRGEYMSNYSWAEYTTGQYVSMQYEG